MGKLKDIKRRKINMMQLGAALHPHGSLPVFNRALVYGETQGKGPHATGESMGGGDGSTTEQPIASVGFEMVWGVSGWGGNHTTNTEHGVCFLSRERSRARLLGRSTPTSRRTEHLWHAFLKWTALKPLWCSQLHLKKKLDIAANSI